MNDLCLLTCGGTIAMSLGSDGILRSGTSDNVAAFVSSVWDGDVVHVPVSEKDSTESSFEDWATLARAVSASESSRVLVTHGTDTLSWTAAALAASGVGRTRTIVLTAANVPLGEEDSDATTNLVSALLALDQLGPGVWVVFSGVRDEAACVFEGGFVRKLYAGGACFFDVGGAPFGTFVDGELVTRPRREWSFGAESLRSGSALSTEESFSNEVTLVRAWPGAVYDEVAPGATIVVETYACGTVGTSLVAALRSWVAAGARVVVVGPGPLPQGLEYEVSLGLLESGAELRFDVTAELAVCLLSLS